MKCPVCNIELRMTDRQGVEIDYCPQCRGVWLDRGELDKIVAMAESQSTRERGYRDMDDAVDHDHDDHDHDDHRDRDRRDRRDGHGGHREGSNYGGRKREGFFSNLFDMFGD